MFDRAEHCRQIGHKGGNTTVERYGRNYMRAIGRVGAKVTIEKHGVGYFHGLMEGKRHVFRSPDVARQLAFDLAFGETRKGH